MNYCVLGNRAGAAPYNNRHPAAVALIAPGEVLLFDCGEGSVLQMQRASIRRGAVSAVFITHRHADHCLGLLGLVAAFSSDRRSEPLTIVAPPEVNIWLRDSLTTLGVSLEFELECIDCPSAGAAASPVEVFSSGDMHVFAAPVDHRVPAFAFRCVTDSQPRIDIEALEARGVDEGVQVGRLRREGRLTLADGSDIFLEDFLLAPHPPTIFAYSGDTAPCEALAELARDADVFVCEATFTAKYAERAAHTRHMTAAAAAEIAERAGVKQLVLTHFSTRYRDALQHLTEARRRIPHVTAAVELEILPLKP